MFPSHDRQWYAGEDTDSESGCSHLSHVAANMLMLLHQQELGTMTDDRYLTHKTESVKVLADIDERRGAAAVGNPEGYVG